MSVKAIDKFCLIILKKQHALIDWLECKVIDWALGTGIVILGAVILFSCTIFLPLMLWCMVRGYSADCIHLPEPWNPPTQWYIPPIQPAKQDTEKVNWQKEGF